MNVRNAVESIYGRNVNCRIEDEVITVWREEFAQPTDEELNAKIVELKAEYDALEYARNREEAYPSTGDQLDYMYHNGFEKWKTDMIDPIKDKYPKG